MSSWSLQDLLSGSGDPRIQYVDHVVGNGEEFLNHCRDLGLEGIVSKRRQSVYRSGRSGCWLKTKCVRLQPFVVGGSRLSEERPRCVRWSWDSATSRDA